MSKKTKKKQTHIFKKSARKCVVYKWLNRTQRLLPMIILNLLWTAHCTLVLSPTVLGCLLGTKLLCTSCDWTHLITGNRYRITIVTHHSTVFQKHRSPWRMESTFKNGIIPGVFRTALDFCLPCFKKHKKLKLIYIFESFP